MGVSSPFGHPLAFPTVSLTTLADGIAQSILQPPAMFRVVRRSGDGLRPQSLALPSSLAPGHGANVTAASVSRVGWVPAPPATLTLLYALESTIHLRQPGLQPVSVAPSRE